MKKVKPSLRLVLLRPDGKEKIVNFSNLSWEAAKKLFEKNYFLFALIKGKGSRKRAGKYSRMAPHWISRQITLLGLKKEFPLQATPNRYEYDYTLSTSEFVLFNGTLKELEDRYVLQVSVNADGDRHKVLAMLRAKPHDAYPGRVLRRLERKLCLLEKGEDLDLLVAPAKHNPIIFQGNQTAFRGTLAALRKHYMMQVLTICKGHIKKARRMLGIEKPAVFRQMLARYIPRRQRKSPNEAGAISN